MQSFIHDIFTMLIIIALILSAGSILIFAISQPPKQQKSKGVYEIELKQYKATHKTSETVYMFYSENNYNARKWLINTLKTDEKNWIIEATGIIKTIEKEIE